MQLERPICQLCRSSANELVNSHIVPKAFGFAAKTYVTKKFNRKHSKRVLQGIYGQFLCDGCEQKFSALDKAAVDLFKKGKSSKLLHKRDCNQALVIENAFEVKEQLHQFALSLLWRAACSNREEYSSIKLGSFQEQIRDALHNQTGLSQLCNQTSLLFQKYETGEDYSGQIFQPYRLLEKNTDFCETFGSFDCHVFGFPNGELFVRLGGDNPRQGYFEIHHRLEISIRPGADGLENTAVQLFVPLDVLRPAGIAAKLLPDNLLSKRLPADSSNERLSGSLKKPEVS
jgi:hypothetical protein